MEVVLCYELFGGMAHKNHSFLFIKFGLMTERGTIVYHKKTAIRVPCLGRKIVYVLC